MTMVYLTAGIVVFFVIVAAYRRMTDEPIPQDITDAQIGELARQGIKILAIRSYRQLHGVGLKEAKEAVEAMVE